MSPPDEIDISMFMMFKTVSSSYKIFSASPPLKWLETREVSTHYQTNRVTIHTVDFTDTFAEPTGRPHSWNNSFSFILAEHLS